MGAVKLLVALVGAVLIITFNNAYAHTPPGHATVFFENLLDGDVVESPVTVKFGITPAGTTGKRRHMAGHHHLLVDMDRLPDLDAEIPRDNQHIHFDGGETEARLELPPGKHTLQLLLADEQHEPQDPPLMSEKITIFVK